MNLIDRQLIARKIRYELHEGSHTFTMCKCNRRGSRTEKCWECWLEDLEMGEIR